MGSSLLDQLRKNFEYDYWANDKYLKALSGMAQPPEKAVKLMAHVLFASDVWLARLQGEDLSRFTDIYPPYTLTDCRQVLDGLRERWNRYITSLQPGDLTRQFSYPNLQGKRFEQTVQNVLVHVVHHSHYHRGQLATLVHQGGGERPGTDYIGYALEIGEGKAL